VLKSNAKYVEKHFSPQHNSELLRNILNNSFPPGAMTIEYRIIKGVIDPTTDFSLILIRVLLLKVVRRVRSKLFSLTKAILEKTYLLGGARVILGFCKKCKIRR
jgi:hypothetical protein